jgi:hypothetical protein
LIQITYIASPENEKDIKDLLNKYCRKLRLVNMKNLGENSIEAFYQVTYKRKDKSSELLSYLNEMDQVQHVNLFFDDDDADGTT